MRITAANLYDLARGAKPAIVDGIVAAQQIIADAGFLAEANLRNQFFAQVCHESGYFTRTVESLYYTDAARIRQVWPSRFPTNGDAQPYVRNERKLANKVYNGRLGNAVGSDDGYLFRGSNLLQHTGRDAHRWVTGATGVDAERDPDAFRANIAAGVKAAVRWWQARPNLMAAARAGKTTTATQIINGGQNGIADRIRLVERASRVAWGEEGATPAAASTMLRRGSKGPDVLRYQQRLKAHGFYVDGLLDSDFGPGMENAVRAAQEDFGLVADGVIGPATKAALDAAPATTIHPPKPPAPEPEAPRRGWCDRPLRPFF